MLTDGGVVGERDMKALRALGERALTEDLERLSRRVPTLSELLDLLVHLTRDRLVLGEAADALVVH